MLPAAWLIVMMIGRAVPCDRDEEERERQYLISVPWRHHSLPSGVPSSPSTLYPPRWCAPALLVALAAAPAAVVRFRRG